MSDRGDALRRAAENAKRLREAKKREAAEKLKKAVMEPDECTADPNCHYKIIYGAAAYERHLEQQHPDQGKAKW